MTTPPAPLECVAPDIRPLVAAFRDAGGISFQHRTVAQARVAYLTSCRDAAPSVGGRVDASDHRLPGPDNLTVRVYRSATTTLPAPGVVFFHGGGWVIGDLDSHDGVCRHLCHTSEAVVVAVDYRLAPEHPFPAAHDALTATDWVLDHAAELGIDRERVVVVGDSAGGSLATWVAASRTDTLAGQVLLYPVTDLTMSSSSYTRVTDGFALTAASMRWFADAYRPDGNRDRVELSPLLHPVPVDPPPTFVLTVGHDPLADEGIAWAAALARAGAEVEHRHLPRHAHGLVTSAGLVPTGERVLRRVAAFVRDRALT